MKKLPSILLIIVLSASFMSIACGASMGKPAPRNAAANNDDLTITTRVKTALINEPAISATIDVETFQGVVTLAGRVKSKAEEDKAVAVARTIRGVTDVKSKLQIQP